MNQRYFTLLDKIVLGRAKFQAPFKASSALQDEARFVHIVSGNSRLCSPKHQFDLKTGDSLLMKCEQFVNHWTNEEADRMNEVIIWHFYPDILHHIYDNQIPAVFTAGVAANPEPIESINETGVVAHFVEGLRYYFDHPSLMTDDLLKIKFKELVLILLNSDPSGRVKTMLANLFREDEYEFKEVIYANIFEDHSLQDLAFFTGLSLSSFKRKFQTVFGMSPGVFIKSKRLEKARDLLENSNQRITEIAFECGFNDVGYFSKTFAAAFQSSPSEYRKNVLN